MDMEYILPCSLLIYDSHHRQDLGGSNGLAPVIAPLPPTLLPLHKCAKQDRRLHASKAARAGGRSSPTNTEIGSRACCSSSRYDSYLVDIFLAIWISTHLEARTKISEVQCRPVDIH